MHHIVPAWLPLIVTQISIYRHYQSSTYSNILQLFNKYFIVTLSVIEKIWKQCLEKVYKKQGNTILYGMNQGYRSGIVLEIHVLSNCVRCTVTGRSTKYRIYNYASLHWMKTDRADLSDKKYMNNDLLLLIYCTDNSGTYNGGG